MRSILTTAAVIGAVIGLSLPALASPTTVAAGTQVKVRLVNSISSGTAVVGQRFAIQATAPLIEGNRVVIAKGASGTGRVVEAKKAQGKSAGEMTLEFTSIHASDGSRIPLTAISHPTHGNSEKGKASTATVISTIALGPLGLFAHNMVKGKDITVSPASTFSAWVKTNSTVNVP